MWWIVGSIVVVRDGFCWCRRRRWRVVRVAVFVLVVETIRCDVVVLWGAGLVHEVGATSAAVAGL